MNAQSRLAQIRRDRGLSASELANRVGVRRQTIYAIEASTYMPNTLIALRLAEVLGVPVEGLFFLKRSHDDPIKEMEIEVLTEGDSRNRPGQPVNICSVRNRLIAVPAPPVLGSLPSADTILLRCRKRSKATIRSSEAGEKWGSRLLAAGCDPAMPLLARHLAKYRDIDLVTAETSSLQALQWLKDGKVHIAGTHLRDMPNDDAGLPVVDRLLRKGSFKATTFAVWEEGLVVAHGNPKRISSLRDLDRKDVSIINRQNGSGSRLLLDYHLAKEGVSPQRIRGYSEMAHGHILAAWHVQSGKADCCIATRAAARIFGLDFLSMAIERFDFIIPMEYWDTPPVQIMIDALNSSALRQKLSMLGGYDTSQTGRVF